MGKLVSINGDASAPDAELIAELEALLNDARAGRLSALVGRVEYANGDAFTLTLGAYDPAAMAGHLLALAIDEAQSPE